ncbi:carboxypeptidase regulatory-like domain-containing protein [Corallococcus sp. AB049A]|uniref:carboxypeptidase-like regulatory domain-containing protein n=1 Tax=Corallococcus sp. AB049A TaxID=2316721 RepID=UPI000ED1AEA3|nr:carboxypeptidase-like regulatory domain-containing protein [Corallococcus sp. AB049A]RKI67868.1 carboxypeptidase regulatory-like domain-containing protein [Corallococcus sp. AB049A]
MTRGHRRAAFLIAGSVVVLLLAFFLRADENASRHPDRSASGGPGSLPGPRASSAAMASSRESLRISGIVRDAQGPVAGVRVSASRVDAETLSQRACPLNRASTGPSCAGQSWLTKCCFHAQGFELARLVDAREGEAPVFAQTVTADDGTFSLEGLAEGSFTLWALDDRGTAMRPEVPAGSTDVTLMLEAGSYLSGTVVDNDTRVPIPGARVISVLESQSRFFDALTNAQGRFRMGPLPPGQYLQVVSAQGWRTTPFRDLGWLDTDKDATLEVRKQARLEGLVLTPEGRPASGITVQAFRGGVSDEIQSTRSDAQGRFVFEDVAMVHHTVWARNETAFGDAPARPPAKVVIRMEPVTFMEGTVSDERGRPLEGVRLRGGNLPEVEPSAEAFSDAAGHYRLGPLLRDGMILRLSRARYRNKYEEIDLRTLHPGPWDFTLQRTGSVEGWVVDTQGTPLPGIRLTLANVPEDSLKRDVLEDTHTRSDDAGHFILDTSAEGSGYLLAESEEFAPVGHPVDFPSTGVRVVLSRGASVSGRVVDAKGEPLPHAEVLLWAPEALDGMDPPRSLRVDSEGSFSAAGLNAGPHVLEARLPTSGIERSVTETLELEAHSQVTVSLRFDEGRTVKGLTVGSDGQPLAGVRVQACLSPEDAPAWRAHSLRCDADAEQGVLSGPGGHFVLKHLMDPSHRLVAWKEGHAFVPAGSRGGTPGPDALVVKTGAEGIQLVLRQQPRLRGRIVSEDGSPVPGGVWDGRNHTPAPEGAFELPLLEEGPGQVRVRAKGHLDLKRDFVASPGKDIDLGTLVMRRSRTTRFIILDEATHAPLVGARAYIGPSDNGSHLHRDYGSFYGNLDTEGGAEVEGLPFAPILMSVSLRSGEPGTDVPLDARQETVTVRVPDPKR